MDIYKFYFQNSQDLICVIDKSFSLEKINHKFLQLLEYSEEEILGKPIFNFIHSEDINSTKKYLECLKTANGVQSFINRFGKKKGGYLWLSWKIMADPATENFYGILKEVSKNKLKKSTSEIKIQSILDLAPDTIVVFDSIGTINMWNTRAEKLFGWKKNEVIGNLLSDFIIPKTNQNGYKKRMYLLLNSKTPCMGKPIEMEVINKAGMKFFISYSITWTLINEKKIFIGFIRDITENKKANEALKFSESFLNSIIENIPNMIFVKNAKDLKYVKFNKAGEDLLGYKKDELIGKNNYDFYSKKEADYLTEKEKKIFNVKNLIEVKEESVYTKNSGLKILETKHIPIYDSTGMPIYILGISNDVTERKRMYEELDNKTKELARSNSELEQFAYIASHDLQEPLRTINSYLDLIEKRYHDKIDEEGKEFIHFVTDASKRMRTLIQSLLAYSRINRIQPFAIIDLKELMENVLENLHSSIEENKVTISFQELPNIYGDYVLIQQLFQNLIENAIKFRGSENPKVAISCIKKGAKFLFTIKDNGIGIKKENLGKLFVVFQRFHSQQEYPGTGIGLAICKKIVERHKGDIWVESEINKGTTFYFTLGNKDSMKS